MNAWESICSYCFFLEDNSFSSSTTNPHAQIFRRVSIHICVFLGDYCFSSSTTNPHVQMFGRVSVHIVFFGEIIPSPVLLIPTRKFSGECLLIFGGFGGAVAFPVVLLIPTCECLGEHLFILFFLGDNSFSSTANPHAQIFRRVSVNLWGFWGDCCFSSSTTNPHAQMFGRVSVHIVFFGR